MYSYQSLEGNAHGAPPAKPAPGWKKIFNARQKVSGVRLLASRRVLLGLSHLHGLKLNADDLKDFYWVLLLLHVPTPPSAWAYLPFAAMHAHGTHGKGCACSRTCMSSTDHLQGMGY